MPDRKCLVSTLWLTFALAMLASVLVAPIRTSGSDAVSSRPDCLRRDFGLLPGQPAAYLSAAPAADADLQLSAFPLRG